MITGETRALPRVNSSCKYTLFFSALYVAERSSHSITVCNLNMHRKLGQGEGRSLPHPQPVQPPSLVLSLLSSSSRNNEPGRYPH